ncbi:RNA demethylase ALKBH10B [Heracleum sosnowskyi]|uniref:RNA demethylase ALKBH10B n=1 Tax=Heracleum sosnowskyi TaxID=360622 RepID=A0AAD8MQ53_9APIA|nr:RNA demethylase ALKBH10B [Heracleum sosnowskyi]
MAMPEKIHGGVVAGAEMMGHYHPQWVPDERDGFISWIRSEFAAANAIIDSLCDHLKGIGDQGEYDAVIGSLQLRRVNWYPVLHLQHFFSVSEVAQSLDHVAWRRRERYRGGGGGYRRGFEQGKGPGKRFDGGGWKRGVEVSGREAIAKGDDKVAVDGVDLSTKSQVDDVSQSSGNVSANESGEGEVVDDGVTSDAKGSCEVKVDKGPSISPFSHGKKDISVNAKTFVGTEIVDGKSVNAVDGMKLYEELFDSPEVANLVSLVNDLRTTGRKGLFQAGPTFIKSHRPTRGHGKEMIQLGIPIVDSRSEDRVAGRTFKERRIEPIPRLLQDVIDRLIALQVITVEPDCCIIDYFDEGDHSQPYMWPHRFGRPICVLFLTECDMTFGEVIAVEGLGNYKGSIKLSVTPGSMLVMQGRSTDFARYALPALQKQRILVTLTKSQPKRSSGHYPSVTAATQSQWIPPQNRSANHIHNSLSSKHHPSVSTTGASPPPSICMPLPPANGVQPIFMATAVAPVLPLTAPVVLPPTSAGWNVAGPRHAPPRLPVPGTGVFLPPGSGNISNQTSGNESYSSQAEKGNGTTKLNGNDNAASDLDKESETMSGKDCSGTNGEQFVGEEPQKDVVVKEANEPAETIL